MLIECFERHREFVDSSYLLRTCFGLYSWDSRQIRSRFMVKPRTHKSTNEVRIPTNALRICYELTKIYENRDFVAKHLNSSKRLPRIPDRSRIERTDYE